MSHQNKVLPLPTERELYSHKLKILDEKKARCGNDSAKWRDYGNRYYRMGISMSKTDKERMMDFSVAKLFYDSAEQKSKNQQEHSSASKNIATVSWKISSIVLKSDYRWGFVLDICSEMVAAFDRAKQNGKNSQSRSWMGALETTRQRALEDVWDIVVDFKNTKHVQALVETIGLKIEMCDLKCKWFLKLADYTFKRSVCALEDNKFKDAISELRECYRPIEEAKRTIGYLELDDTHEISSEIRVLEQDITFQTCHAEALQALEKGDDLLEFSTKHSENLTMDMLWDAVDQYRLSIILTRENDVEVEAIARSKLGIIYDEVFKIKHRALDNFKQCISLAHSLQPRKFNQTDWFTKASQALEKYQKERQEEEDRKWENIRDKHIHLVQEKIDKLGKEYKKVEKNFDEKKNKKFLVFLYTEWPPKHRTYKTPSEGESALTLKKWYRNASIHYHPDRVSGDAYSIEYKIMMEAISQCVSSKYSEYKTKYGV